MIIDCKVDGEAGDGYSQGSCPDRKYCYSDGVCRGFSTTLKHFLHLNSNLQFFLLEFCYTYYSVQNIIMQSYSRLRWRTVRLQ